MKLTVHGEPRTKKTSNQTILVGRQIGAWLRPLLSLPDKHLARSILNRVKVLPSKAHRKWVKDSRIEFHQQGPLSLPLPDQPYNCKAIFYRSRRIGDAVGFYQGLADLLQDKNISSMRGMTLNILTDDKWIQAWDGSRLEIDREKPRVVVELTPMEHTIDLMEALVDSLGGEREKVAHE